MIEPTQQLLNTICRQISIPRSKLLDQYIEMLQSRRYQASVAMYVIKARMHNLGDVT